MITDSKVIVDDFLQRVISLVLSWVQIDLVGRVPPPASPPARHLSIFMWLWGRRRDTSLMDN